MVRSSIIELLDQYQNAERAADRLSRAADYLFHQIATGDDWEPVMLLEHMRRVVRLDSRRILATVAEQLNRGGE